ncbi:hypothetical protein NF867_17305 [Solitalea sp. MAHUQ-68]|uniref:HEAT repeat domain-containing protein n=1 Tax=Solitalea agri TaxID=2953739 RepID=A0A9X2JDM3_9SPHI|nr:HEAT repeat domain-containing protein [Solitalea agri]MCO4294622.1 hypothetical protein [Solitalea agri]
MTSIKQKKPIGFLLYWVFALIFLIPLNGISKNSKDNKAAIHRIDQAPPKSILKGGQPRKELSDFAVWVLGSENISSIKKQLLAFGNNFPPSFQPSYFQFVKKVYTYPIIILLLLLIGFLIANILTVLLIIYFGNNIKNHKERYHRIFLNSYEENLQSYLFGDIEWDLVRLKLKRTNKKVNRKILTHVLLSFKENLKGEMDEQITHIYLKLGLEKDSLKLTKSKLYYRRIEGLKALTNLDPKSAKEIVPNFLNDSNYLVRTEAQIAYVMHYPESPFEFLKTLKNPFTPWTQLSSFHFFRLHQVPVPVFETYIESEIPTIRNFSLRMIIFFQQFESAPAIFKMLDNEVELTRALAIRAINNLRLYDGASIIKDMYPSETLNNKLEIIKALKNIGDEADFNFLESIIRSESISLKTEACRSLHFISNIGTERLNLLGQGNKDLNIGHFVAHVTDHRN